MNILNVLAVLFVLYLIFSIIDIILFATAPYEIRSFHWWSLLPGSGFVAQWKSFICNKQR